MGVDVVGAVSDTVPEIVHVCADGAGDCGAGEGFVGAVGL
jgi:hypothetical protein